MRWLMCIGATGTTSRRIPRGIGVLRMTSTAKPTKSTRKACLSPTPTCSVPLDFSPHFPISTACAGGNAFNQRAVLAGYEKRDLAAVYHYFRSLSVAAPFTVARENLRQLFEQLRRRQRKLPSAEEGRAPRSLHGWKLPELVEAVELRFLHLQGTPQSPPHLPEVWESASNFKRAPGLRIRI